jgi:UDP-glucuronate decarboxylase
MVDGLMKMMNSSDDFTGPVNLGTDDERSVKDIAQLIITLTNSNSKIIYKRLPSDDPCRRKPDLSLAKKKLKFSAKIKLEDGLEKTITYFRSVK